MKFILYKNRGKFKKISVKVGIIFSKLGLSPNQWTVISLLPAFLALYFLIKSEFIISALLFIFSAFIDLIDGSVARVTGKVSKIGAYLDTVVDRYVEFLVLFGLILISLPELFLPAYTWIFLLLFGSLLTTYVKAAAKEKNLIKEELKGGVLERAERLVILFVGILAASLNKIYLVYVLIFLAILTNLSALQRVIKAIRLSKKP